MSALRNVEDTIGGFVERVFGRLFRGHGAPVELARKLAREMEDHKVRAAFLAALEAARDRSRELASGHE